MKKLVLFLVVYACTALPIVAKSQEKVNQRETLKAIPFPSPDVRLEPSWIKEREERNTVFLKSMEADRLLHNFRITAGLSSNAIPLAGWEAPDIGLRGHFVGHYLSAVASLVERYHDLILEKQLAYLIDELGKCQQAHGNGYLSAFPEKSFDILESKFTGVWAPYYTLHKLMQGLLDTYVCTGNRKAYDILLGMADYVRGRMNKLDRKTIKRMLYTTEANPQNEAGAMNEVLYRLYALSGDSVHLELARLFDPEWFATPLAEGKDILSGLHSNTHLVLVNGFARRYETTGEEKYRAATFHFWDMLINRHAYANGSSSGPRPNATTKTSITAEHWGMPGHLSCTLSKEIAESCVSHNTRRLADALFSWTASPQYADTGMNLFYNAVLPIQGHTPGAYVYHLPLGAPRKKKYLKEDDFACCSGSSAEAYARLNQSIYYHNDTAVWVNLYVPSCVSWKERGIGIKQQGNFPQDTTVRLTVSARHKARFSLRLLIPSWAKGAEVKINGEWVSTASGASSYLELNRTWGKNDEISLTFHYDFHLKPMPDNPQMVAFCYGPQLLAFKAKSEVILKGDVDEILRHLSQPDRSRNEFLLENAGRTYQLRPLYDIDEETYGVYATIRDF